MESKKHITFNILLSYAVVVVSQSHARPIINSV